MSRSGKLHRKLRGQTLYSEAQAAEEALMLRRRVKVALTKAYKRLDYVLQREERLGNIDKVIDSTSKLPTDSDLEHLIVCYAIKKARMKVKR